MNDKDFHLWHMMKIRHKFNATRDERDGQKFDSKIEAQYYDRLKILEQAGDVLFFLRQVPFHLPGGITYRCDFVEFHASGEVVFVDVKGVETKEFIRNKKQVEALYPVDIKVVKKV